MRFAAVSAFVVGVASVFVVALAIPRSGLVRSEVQAEDFRDLRSLRSEDARAALGRSSYREDVVHAAVSRLAHQAQSDFRAAVPAAVTTTASNSPLNDEIRILREEKRVLEQQHLALVNELRELRRELTRVRKDGPSEDIKTELDAERQIRRQVERELASTQSQLLQLQQANDDLANTAREAEQARLALAEERAEQEKILSRLPEVRDKMATLKDEVSAAESKLMECSQRFESLQERSKEIPALQQATQETSQKLERCESDVQSQAALLEQIPVMKQELIAAKNELLMKETELRVLRGAAEPTTLAEVAKATREVRTPAAAAAVAPDASNSDMLIVEVTSSKVNLRSGPGTEHSPVMQVQKKTRLTVESKEGEWYRVFTPTGSRAYISDDVVRELNTPAAPSPQKVQAPSQTSDRSGSATTLRDAAKDDSLVPFGVVNLSSNPSRASEERALHILKNGVGRKRGAPIPPDSAGAAQ